MNGTVLINGSTFNENNAHSLAKWNIPAIKHHNSLIITLLSWDIKQFSLWVSNWNTIKNLRYILIIF